jgi:hypothetical protein
VIVRSRLRCDKRTVTSRLCPLNPLDDGVRRQLDRILSSRTFGRTQLRAREFLAFVVRSALRGGASTLKETTIAIAVFGEAADYNSAETSKVRVAAADLRKRLAAYYRNEGRQDAIAIDIPVGAYVPTFQRRPVYLRVGPFENWTPLGRRPDLGPAVAGELAQHLNEVALVRATTGRTSTFRYQVRGSFGHSGEIFTLTYCLIDMAKERIVYWASCRGTTESVLRMCKSVAHTIRKLVTARLTASDEAATRLSQDDASVERTDRHRLVEHQT